LLGIRSERAGHRQPGASGGKKQTYKHNKKQVGSMKTSRSSPGHLGAVAADDERDPESYQTVSVQVRYGTFVVECR
jgi:hypothetical protein